MPINVTLGATVVFTTAFYSSAGVLTVPSSATMTVTYPPSSAPLTSVSCAIDMVADGNFFTATWGTGVSALGIASYTATAPGQVDVNIEQLRITS